MTRHARTLEADIAEPLADHGVAGIERASLPLRFQAVIQVSSVVAKASGDREAARESVWHLKRYVTLPAEEKDMTDMRALSVERHIAAPVGHVWRTMIDRFEDWFCPRPWRAEARDIEWRPGGRSLVVMHGPNGEEMPNDGVILEYEPNRRFVFTDAFTVGWQPHGPFMVGMFEIAQDGDDTRFTATARHWTEAALEQHRLMGFEGGWGAMADQLKTLAEGGAL